MGKRPSLIHQIKEELFAKVQEGRSKHQDKLMGTDFKDVIYSWQTYRTYLKQCCETAKWVQQHYGCQYVEEVKAHVPEYLIKRIEAGMSPYTVRLDASANAKLFGCSSTDWGIKLPKRERAGIHRSRLPRDHDWEFSEENNQDVVDFCRGTGLRRCELIALNPYNVTPDGTTVIVMRGKGGKYREVPVLHEYQAHVKAMREKALDAGRDRVFERHQIKNRMDEHGYRREYAQSLYRLYELGGEHATGRLYHCRKDAAGICFDKGVMLAVSIALGHNRLDVIAISYLI